MKLSTILEPLIRANVDGETLLATVRAFEEQQEDALEKRREADRERQARKRENDTLSRDVTLRHSDRQRSRSHAHVEDISSSSKITGKDEDKAAPSKKATRLAADWSVPHDWIAEAVTQGLSPQQAHEQADCMRDWSLSDKNGAKLDWHATWRNWIRRAAKTARSTNSPARRRNYVDVAKDRINASGSEGLFGNDRDAQRFSAGSFGSRPHDEDIRGGFARRIVGSSH